ncbi:hypothetical protein [Nocardia sp. NPDC057227]|uniref:hypothetical protein n=1 Tax=Nocardia sp. NPDC057227 TaxID=3346056 RepID=UPI00363747B5
MSLLAAFGALETRDKVTTVLTFVTIVISIAAFVIAIRSQRVSEDALQVSRYEAASVYRVTMQYRWKDGKGNHSARLEGEDVSRISVGQFLNSNSWLQVEVANVSNRLDTVLDLGLVTDSEEASGYWINNEEYAIPEYCAEDTDAHRDVKCFSYPVLISVGNSVKFLWHLPYWGQRLIDEGGVSPVSVGIVSRSGTDVFATNLVVEK